jgi:hypothetical protein
METEGRILDPEHPAVSFYLKKYQVQFIGEDASVWVRFHIDQCGSIKALFEDDYQKLFQPNAYFINITDNPEQLKNFKIKEVRVSEVERDKVECEKKYQVVFVATNGLEWVRFYVDECGRIWACFADDYRELFKPNVDYINITDYPESLETGFKIEEVLVCQERIA